MKEDEYLVCESPSLCLFLRAIDVHVKCYPITVDVASEDLKSPAGNTVWVRPPPALIIYASIDNLSQNMGYYSQVMIMSITKEW